MPYQYGFEAEDGWKTENLGSGNTWTIEETNSFYAASEGSKNARYRFSASTPANAWYVSRGIQLTKDLPITIKFDYRTGGFNGIEKLKVAIGKNKNARDCAPRASGLPVFRRNGSDLRTFGPVVTTTH